MCEHCDSVGMCEHCDSVHVSVVTVWVCEHCDSVGMCEHCDSVCVSIVTVCVCEHCDSVDMYNCSPINRSWTFDSSKHILFVMFQLQLWCLHQATDGDHQSRVVIETLQLATMKLQDLSRWVCNIVHVGIVTVDVSM